MGAGDQVGVPWGWRDRVQGETGGTGGLSGGGDICSGQFLESMKVILVRTSCNGEYRFNSDHLWEPGKASSNRTRLYSAELLVLSKEKALCNLPSDICQLILDKEEQTNKVLFKIECLGYFITFCLENASFYFFDNEILEFKKY